MAKFCKYCGKSLEDGQVCDCAASVAAAQPVSVGAAQSASVAAAQPAEAPASAQQPSFNTEKAAATAKAAGAKAKSAFTLWAKSLLTYLKTPRQGVTNALNDPKNLVLAGIYAGVNALAVFFFLWAMLGKTIGSVANLAGGFGAQIKVGYPVFVLLLSGIICAVVFIGMSALALFVAAKLNKRELDIKKALVIACVSSTYPTALLLAGTLLGLLSIWLAVVCLVAAALVWAINACTDLYDYAGLNGTRSLKEMLIMLGVMVVVLLVCFLITRSLITWSINEVTISGVKLGDMGGMIGDLSDLFG